MKTVLSILLFFSSIRLIAAAGIDWSGIDIDNPRDFVPGEIMVRFAGDVNITEIQSTISAQGSVPLEKIETLNVLHIRVPEGSDIRDVLEAYQARPDVLYAEPVAILRANWIPNDPYFSYQWNFDSGHLNMPIAWDTQKGSSSVVVGILDTGIAFENYVIPAHEAYEVYSSDNAYHICPDLTSTQFVAGYDFVHDDSHPNDQQGHGTHVSGTVAQATNNWIGVAGMAPNCKLMPVQVLDYSGSGTADDLAQGIIWAADHGADVINMSLGWPSANDSNGLSAVHDAMIYAYNKDVVIVVSAGNEGVGKVSYPAGFPECISVAALDYNNVLAPYSQYGSGLDISAPGGNTAADENNDGYVDGILQCTFTYPGDETGGAVVDSFAYPFWQGTSMAAPHVSGLAALIISNGISGVENVKQRIYSTATDLGASGYDTRYGNGMINPVAALTGGGEDNPPNTPAAPQGPSSASTGQSVSFSASTTDPDGDKVAYRFDWGDGNFSTWSSYVSSGSSQSMSHSYYQSGTYYVKAKARDESGDESSWSAGSAITVSGASGGLELPVLQNPLLSQYIDIWVIPTSGSLTSEPEVKVTLNGYEETVYMVQVPQSEGYVGDYTFFESGTATIDATAGSLHRSRTFSVGEVSAAGGSVTSEDARVSIYIPPGAFETPSFVTIIPELTSEGSANPFSIPPINEGQAVGYSYRIGPAKKLGSEGCLRFKIQDSDSQGADPASLCVMTYKDGAWSKVQSFADRNTWEIVAWVSELGTYQLTRMNSGDSPDLPQKTELSLTSTNPFARESSFVVKLDAPSNISLDIFDASGRKVRSIVRGTFNAGVHELGWDGKDGNGHPLSGGMYFAVLTTPQGSETLKLTLVR